MSTVLAKALAAKPRSLNKTEGRYYDLLLLEQSRGKLVAFRFHAITLVLGPDCRYTPEVMVIRQDGTIEFHEVKGPYIRNGDDGMVKLRAAAAAFPWFRFYLAQEDNLKRWVTSAVQW